MKVENFLSVIGGVWILIGIVSLYADYTIMSAIYNTTGSIFLAMSYVLMDLKEKKKYNDC